jgi:signal transduction histidine kinase
VTALLFFVALLALWRVAVLERRLVLVARADHELRGPLTTLLLACRQGLPPGAELARVQLGLADLAAARHGRRAKSRTETVELPALARRVAPGRVTVDWAAGPAVIRADPRRLSQALGNLVANARQHGRGDVVIRGRRVGARVRIEVADDGPGIRTRRRGGHGLAIADAAAADAGGRLEADAGHPVIDLPVSS